MLSNLLTIGKSALSTSQAWVTVTGNNIANADTEGYTRRYVVQKEAATVTLGNNQYGLGSNAEQVLRYFDKFLEDAYLNESTVSSRWTEQDNIMATLESIFNEANTTGLADTLDKFFNSWQKLALYPEDPAVRTSVLTYGQTLDDMFESMYRSVKSVQEEMDISIADTVTRVNEITKAVANINKKIGESTISQVTNPNGLYDQRDALVEELATLVNIKTIDNGAGDYRVQLDTGQPLVESLTTYDLEFQGPQAQNRLMPDSKFEGTVQFEGADDFEYSVEIVHAGKVGDSTDPPLFRVSLDGGTTWLVNDDGTELQVPITMESRATSTDPVLVKDVFISFSFPDPSSVGTDGYNLNVGDSFDIVPKKGLYWIEPTRGPENITPQITLNGADNPDRLTGGKLSSYFNIRDDACGRYLDELDALAKSMVWEVNRLHSQGAGLEQVLNVNGNPRHEYLSYVNGQVSVPYEDKALGTKQSGNVFSDKLAAGNANFYFYDTATGDYAGTAQLSFSPLGTFDKDATGGATNFDPTVHSLNDVCDAINSMTIMKSDGTTVASNLHAYVQDGKLLIRTTDDTMSFAFGEDTTGLWAALGVNSFFSGDTAHSIAVSTDIANDYTKVNAGRVNGGYEVNEGDNTMANAIGALQTKNVTINTFWRTVSQSIPEYYNGLISTVGSDKLHTATNKAYHSTLMNSTLERKESVSGVNLDEELANLVKYQSSYKAAAKLITTADEMLGVLIGLKQ